MKNDEKKHIKNEIKTLMLRKYLGKNKIFYVATERAIRFYNFKNFFSCGATSSGYILWSTDRKFMIQIADVFLEKEEAVIRFLGVTV